MNTRLALTATALVSAVAAANAQNTFATFANLASTNSDFLTFTRTLNTFTGSGKITSFVLGNTTYNNVDFTMSVVGLMNPPSIISAVEANSGSWSITSGSTTLLSATFDGARLSSNGAWNTAFNADYLNQDNVTFGGLVSGDQSMNGFSFALSPKVGSPNSYNASFSAVGNVQAVPEPASMAALGLGALALIRKRRNRA